MWLLIPQYGTVNFLFHLTGPCVIESITTCFYVQICFHCRVCVFCYAVTRQNLVIEGAVMYTDTTYVWVNYSSVGICDPLVWQLGYSVGGEEIIVNYTSIYSTHVLELKSNRTAPISTIRGRVLFTTGDDRNASSQLDVFEGEWSDEYPLPAFPVIRRKEFCSLCISIRVAYFPVCTFVPLSVLIMPLVIYVLRLAMFHT